MWFLAILQEVRYRFRLICNVKLNTELPDMPLFINTITVPQSILSSYVDAYKVAKLTRGKSHSEKAGGIAVTPARGAAKAKAKPPKFKTTKEYAAVLLCSAAAAAVMMNLTLSVCVQRQRVCV